MSKDKEKHKLSKRKVSWITEFLLECSCKNSPHYRTTFTKITHKTFICKICEKNTKRVPWTNMLRTKTHYVKLPKPMTPEQGQKWYKKNNKQFIKKRAKLIKQKKKTETTLTTKALMVKEKRKKVKIKAQELWLSPRGVKVKWFGEVPTMKQLLPPEKDMEVHIGYKNRTLKFQNAEVTVMLSYKKDRDMKKMAEHEMNHPSKGFGTIFFSVKKCARCGKKSSTTHSTKNGAPKGKKRILCPDCTKAETEPKDTKNNAKEVVNSLMNAANSLGNIP